MLKANVYLIPLAEIIAGTKFLGWENCLMFAITRERLFGGVMVTGDVFPAVSRRCLATRCYALWISSLSVTDFFFIKQ